MNNYVTITVDTENLQTPLIEGKYDENIILENTEGIVELLDKFNVKATFFVDVYEYARFNEKEFKELCQNIQKRGHDVQLHTHPVWVYNSNRKLMYQYTLKEQIEIIKQGKELIKKWIGVCPIAHRAGGYGADKNTLIALRENDILIDSSNFYGHPNCKIDLTKNQTVEKGGIIEVPITIFKRTYQIRVGPYKFKRERYIKTDINWATLEELKLFIQEANINNIKLINIFLHSYSLIDFKNFSNPQPNFNMREKFEQFLEFITNDPEIEIISIKDFLQIYKSNPNKFKGLDYVPEIVREISFKEFLLKMPKLFR